MIAPSFNLWLPPSILRLFFRSYSMSFYSNPLLPPFLKHSSILKAQLTLSWRRPLSYRNRSTDLQSKSMDWFLNDNGLRHERVKTHTHISNLLNKRVKLNHKKGCSLSLFPSVTKWERKTHKKEKTTCGF